MQGLSLRKFDNVEGEIKDFFLQFFHQNYIPRLQGSLTRISQVLLGDPRSFVLSPRSVYRLGITYGNWLITTKSVFFTNQRVLEIYPISWLVDRFFLETIGVEYSALYAATERAAAFSPLTIERKLSRVRNFVLLACPRHDPTSRCCLATFNLHGIIPPVVAGSSHGLY
jgi:hypothetical protein